MKNYVISYSTLGRYNENIQGKNMLDALKNAGVKAERVTGDRCAYADIAVVAGEYDKEKNVLFYYGKSYTRYWFNIVAHWEFEEKEVV